VFPTIFLLKNPSKSFFTALNSLVHDLELHGYITPNFSPCCRLLECTEDALKSLTRATDILKVTHGTKSQFMKELFGKLEEARAEVSFRISSRHGHDE
jgi:hypothetical protein